MHLFAFKHKVTKNIPKNKFVNQMCQLMYFYKNHVIMSYI